jgi:hypothetical protein
VCLPWILPPIFDRTLGLALVYRLGLTAVLLAPVGFLMGMPFPGGITSLLERSGRAPLVSWAWAVNGATSVIASVLAALLALSFGFGWVLRLGALLYLSAEVVVLALNRPRKD